MVKKNIPVKSGMGGGSMNAATLIKIFMKNKIVKVNKKKLQNINDSIGQDVKLGFFKNIMYLDGNNSVKILNKRTKYFLLLFMPKYGCSTKYIFSKVKKYSKPLKNIKNKFNNLGSLKNDLQDIVIKKNPELKKPIEFLEKQMDDNFSEIFAQYVVNDVIWDDFGMEGHRAYCEFMDTNLIALLPPLYPKNS